MELLPHGTPLRVRQLIAGREQATSTASDALSLSEVARHMWREIQAKPRRSLLASTVVALNTAGQIERIEDSKGNILTDEIVC